MPSRIPAFVLATLALLCFVSRATADGSFSVLTYNVRGLPALVIEDRTTEIGQIATRLETFRGTYAQSIVLLQELFDAGYYATITGASGYPNISAKDNDGPNFIGDGLDRLSSFAFTDYEKTQWDMCFGSSGAAGSDCDTNKGFSYATHELETGVHVDVYNLHADAGQDADSRTARRDNISQLIAYVDINSPAGTAVIIGGDTNSLYTRVAIDQDNIDTLPPATSVTDVWVELANMGMVPAPGPPLDSECLTNSSGPDCEQIDKIFYRDGTNLNLSATDYASIESEFLHNPNATDLSDHFPIQAQFSYVVPEPNLTLQALAALGTLGWVRSRRRSV